MKDRVGKAAVFGLISLGCPVCDHAFETARLDSSDTRGGVGRDFFARALGAQPVYYLISTCPRCYYSGYLDDFQATGRADAALRQAIVQDRRLRPATAISPSMKQAEIPAATRYGLAAAVYSLRRAPPEAQGWLLLRWAWVVREDGSYLPPTLTLMQAMREIEPRLPEARRGANQAERELRAVNLLMADWQEGSFEPVLEPYVRLVLAMVLRRHGENVPARDLLSDAKPQVERALVPAIERMLASIEEERRLLAMAREQFELAVTRNEIRPENRAAALYLLGELCRRLGDDPSARTWYDRALADPTLETSLRTWTYEQRELLPAVAQPAPAAQALTHPNTRPAAPEAGR
jgi:hypothetical protein